MSSVTFAWNIVERLNWYPEEEGDRRYPYEPGIWSQVETVPRERLEEIQFIRLRRLLDYAYERSPFYRRLYEQAGVTPGDIRQLKDIQKLPLVDKTMIDQAQAETPIFGDSLTTTKDLVKFWTTTGTTGPARLWVYTREEWENIVHLYARGLYGAGVRPEHRFMICGNYPPGVGPWGCTAGVEYLGAMSIPSGGWNTKKRVKNLLDWEAAGFRATPSYALHMADTADEMGIRLKEQSKVQVIAAVGEPLAAVPATKKLMEEKWQAQVCDMYGVTEIGGTVMFVCDKGALEPMPPAHLNEDYYIFEVLDPETGEVLGPGQDGELCITSLFLYAMPGIRYRTKDIIQVPEPSACSCGRTTLTARGAIKGRTADMFVVKGTNLYVSTLENIIHSVPRLNREFQVVLCASGRFDDIRVRVEPLGGVTLSEYPDLIQSVTDRIKTAVGVTLAVEVVPPGSISGLGEEGVVLKTRRVIDERKEALPKMGRL